MKNWFVIPVLFLSFLLSVFIQNPAMATSSRGHDRWLNSVVIIESESGFGSGFFVSPHGIIITNRHVVGKDDKVTVRLRDGRTTGGIVQANNALYDLALVAIDENSPNWLAPANSSFAKIGDAVAAIGAPKGLSWSLTKGIISDKIDIYGAPVIQTDAAINRVNSGGPLIHARTGKVIGVNTLVLGKSSAESISFARAGECIAKAFGTDLNQYRINHPKISEYLQYMDIANKYATQENYDAAIANVNKALSFIRTGQALGYRAFCHFLAGRYAEATKDISESHKMAPSDARVVMLGALIMIEYENYENAISIATYSLAIDPYCETAYVARGRAYRFMKKYDRALEDLTRAIELDPKDASTYYDQGVTYMEMERYSEALRSFKTAQRLEPEKEDYLVAVQVAQKQAGQTDSYETTTASATSPSDAAIAVVQHGMDEIKQGNHREAVNYLTRGIELAPNFAPAYALRAAAFGLLGEPEKSIADYNKAIILDPRDPEAYAQRGQILMLVGENEKAIKDFTSAIGIEPDKIYYMYRALTWEQMGNYERASLDMRKAEELGAEDTELAEARVVISGYRANMSKRSSACFIGSAWD